MRGGDPICDYSPDEHHCLHEKVVKPERACCWCGDLFISENEAGAKHGPYAPKWGLTPRTQKKIKIR